MKRRLDREVPDEQASLLWASTKVLMGLKYPAEFIETLLRGVQGMRESVTYQAILEEGRAEAIVNSRREDLLFIGLNRFGPPDLGIAESIKGIEDADRLKRMMQRSFDVPTWDELLAIL